MGMLERIAQPNLRTTTDYYPRFPGVKHLCPDLRTRRLIRECEYATMFTSLVHHDEMASGVRKAAQDTYPVQQGLTNVDGFPCVL